MEKTIEIDGQQITFKSTGATPLRYKNQFGADFFSDLMSMLPAASLAEEEGETELSIEDIQGVDFEVLYNIVWVLAKTADKNIHEPLVWLDEFDVFPIIDIFSEIEDLLISSISVKKKKTQVAKPPSQ